MAFDYSKTWVVTWSRSQDCFHVETVDEMLQSNLEVFFHQNPYPSDWIVVGFADTIHEANEITVRLKKKMDDPSFGTPTLE
jgi:hypothetical protein